IAPRLAAAKHDHVVGILERFEQDLAPMVAPMAESLRDNDALPDHVRDLFGLLAQPEHFGESILIGIALGSILSPVIQPALEPEVQGLANIVWPKNPSKPITPPEAAAAVLKGVLTEAEAQPLARLSGVNSENFHTLVEIAGNAPGIAEGLLLLRRGQI